MELVIKESESLLTVSDTIFGYDYNEALVHQVVDAYTSASHQGTRAQKNRANVSGSGKKPWRQKGTGRARAGSVKSPIWRSGGVTFAAKPHNHIKKINKKMYRGALKSVLSELIRQGRLIIVENFFLKAPKTKLLIQKLNQMALDNVLIVTHEIDKNLFLAARNLYKVNLCNSIRIDLISLISSDKTVMTTNAVKQIEEMLL